MRRTRAALAILTFAAVAFFALQLVTKLPSNSGRTVSAALADTATTRLGRLIAPVVAEHASYSGVYALRDARDAFAARIRLAAAAERSLDVQYYIWNHDRSGTLMFDALRAAADRGVRVRLLLDDNNTSGLDPTLAALDSHPNIEVRLFNPFRLRHARVLGYLTDFRRLNRRMHNKSFTADNQAAIVGGRNVGDEYFGATDGVLFADLDVLAVGPVVREVSSEFDRYWASAPAYPVDRLIPRAEPGALEALAAEAAKVRSEHAAVAYLHAIETSTFVRQIEEHSLEIDWVTARALSDDPRKVLGRASTDAFLLQQLQIAFGRPNRTIDLISPYFVPDRGGTTLFREWATHGVRVRILTNSLEATDVAAVHAGYAKRRKALLGAGITLYELRRSPGAPLPGSVGIMGSSGSSLHAKTFAVDGGRAFVGSFNLDPRSGKLNTEMGLLIDSPTMAHGIAEVFDNTIPLNAYQVVMTPDGDLQWIERRQGRTVLYDTEPGTTFWKRAGVWVLSRLPVEWLL